MLNISKVNDETTARTNNDSALQRAENLFILGAKNVLELCVGPSLKTLEEHYKQFKIKCTGNDIEKRWEKYYPEGKWLIGDCFEIDYKLFDAVVFAPPLTKNCTGKRCDSLSVEQIVPSYYDFLEKTKDYKGIRVMVLPGRSFKTSYDRKQTYRLLSKIKNYNIVPLTEGKRKITKYVDIYITK